MRSVPRMFTGVQWRPMLTVLGAGAAAAIIFAATGITNERIDAQGGPTLSVDPASQTVELGAGPFEVSLMVSNVTTPDGLGGYTLAMAYDPTVINGLAITDSGFVNSVGNQAICPSTGIDNDTGILAHLCFTIPLIPEPGPTAGSPQALVNVSFEAVGEGTSIIDIAESSIIDPQGNMLAASKTDGEVVVVRTGGDGELEEPALPNPENASSPGLPDSGGASNGSSNTPLIVALALAGVGVVAVLGTLFHFRARSRSS